MKGELVNSVSYGVRSQFPYYSVYMSRYTEHCLVCNEASLGDLC